MTIRTTILTLRIDYRVQLSEQQEQSCDFESMFHVESNINFNLKDLVTLLPRYLY